MAFNHKKRLAEFLAEDVGSGDITSRLLSRKTITVKIISREDAVLAGTIHAREIFKQRGCKARILKKDGRKIKSNHTIMTVTGNAADILTCERTALNILSRMSGIATVTDELVRKIPSTVKLYSTRKTAPGLRYFDKEAVVIGGGYRHRLGLDEMVMIKDNHVAAGDSLSLLIQKAAKRYRKFEVEVESIKDAIQAASGGATIIMLDNFTPGEINRAIQVLKREKLRDRVILEASGQINSKNIAQYGKTKVDRISVGSITNSVRAIDMSLEV